MPRCSVASHNQRRGDMLGNLGTGEILVIMVFVLIFFGGKKIPEIAKGLGEGIREFKKASRDIQENIENEIKRAEVKQPDAKDAKQIEAHDIKS
jgi:sec-independent protein translocase protein TatA